MLFEIVTVYEGLHKPKYENKEIKQAGYELLLHSTYHYALTGYDPVLRREITCCYLRLTGGITAQHDNNLKKWSISSTNMHI